MISSTSFHRRVARRLFLHLSSPVVEEIGNNNEILPRVVRVISRVVQQ